MAGCSSRSSIEYRVDLASSPPPWVAVDLALTGFEGDSLVLEGLAPASAMRVADVRATSKNGSSLPVTITTRPGPDSDGTDLFTVIRIGGPVPGSLTVHYRVSLGGREGDAHVGFTGRRFGMVTDRFAFARGRDLFLVPSRSRSSDAIGVAFALPKDWSVVAPWSRSGEGWRTGIGGRYAPQDLVSAGLGFGRFVERDTTLQGTRFRFAAEQGISESERAAAVGRLATIAAGVTSSLGRGLGPEFVTVLLPELRSSEELAASGWATGYGGTLAPLTTARANAFAENLLDALIGSGPYASRIKDRSERWLANGATSLIVWRSLAAAGYGTEQDLDRRLAVDYARAVDESDPGDLEWNLEKIEDSSADTGPARETMAPIALLRLERELRASHVALDDVLRRVLVRGDARSLWASLPEAGSGRWKEFRSRVVRGGADMTRDSLFALARPADAPSPPLGPVAQRITLVVTGDSQGYLENCGCTVNQAGGVARRSTVVTRLRHAETSPVFVLDAGNALARPRILDDASWLSEQEMSLYLRTMGALGYSAAAAGPNEFVYGPSNLVQTPFPFLLANAYDTGSRATLAPWRLVSVRGIRLGVIGLMEPATGPWADDVVERRLQTQSVPGDTSTTRRVTFDDPVRVAQTLVPEARKASDLVIAMGTLSPPTIRRLVRECPDLDVVISTDDEAGTVADDGGERSVSANDTPGFLGRTLVLYASMSSFGVNVARLGLDASKRIASADLSSTWLGDSIPDDPYVRNMLTAFYRAVGGTREAQASVPALFPGDVVRKEGHYVGAERCQSCHASEYAQWKTTRHAAAWRTLLDVHRNFQPRCVACHVVGWGTPNGFRLGGGGESDSLVNVQCEVCHGPGGEHARSPSVAMIRHVPESTCKQCHAPGHDDRWDYAAKLPMVMHRPTGESPAAKR